MRIRERRQHSSADGVKKRRGSVMIFSVVLMAAITTVIATTLDLARIVELRQHQSEREAKWRFAVDGIQAISQVKTEKLHEYNQQSTISINNIDFDYRVNEDPAQGNKMMVGTVSGVLEGNSRQETFQFGKRSQINPFWFLLSTTNQFSINKDMKTFGGDLVLRDRVTFLTGSRFIGNWTGDVYTSRSSVSASVTRFDSFFYNQPFVGDPIDLALYERSASSVLPGGTVLKNINNAQIDTPAALIYVDGDLTVLGNFQGNATYVVAGNLNIDGFAPSNPATDRVVFVVAGSVSLTSAVSQCFIYTQGSLLKGGGGTSATILTGAVHCRDLNLPGVPAEFYMDSYFLNNPTKAADYFIPGFWEQNGVLN
jgi:hypothetical protein